jgi:hypothetical protein
LTLWPTCRHPTFPAKFDCALHPNNTLHSSVQLAWFTHSTCTRGNNVKFTYQSLCNPKISTLLKAVRKGFLKGCPKFSEKSILKYLNPSPATTKGLMMHPRHGIWSTQPKPTTPSIAPVPIVPPLPLHVVNHAFPAELHPDIPCPALICDNTDKSIANIFCFGAFADQHSSIVNNNLTGNFLFMSLDGSVCYLVVYHYESNAILTLPISGLDDKTVFDAYKIAFDESAAKGFKLKLNIMGNQATEYNKKFLTKEECKLQLVKPHNHRVNVAKRTIQRFKDAFIATLATTDLDSPIQLCDHLTPQVLNFLNMMRPSHIDPSKSAYETLYGLYNWNQYPLAPLGCKAIIYEDGNTRGSWASRGVGGWYLGPSMDHYCCNVYYIPETRANHISGSMELFPQHCLLPDISPHKYLRTLTDELSDLAPPANATPKGKHLLRLLQTGVHALLHPPPVTLAEQRVDKPIDTHKAQQRIIDDASIITIPLQKLWE